MNQVIRLGDVCDIRSGGTPRRGEQRFYGGHIPWAKIGDLEGVGGLVVSTEESLTDEGLGAIHGRLFPSGTVLLAMYGSVGKVAVAGMALATNQAILGIQVRRPEVLSTKYLRRWLEQIQKKLVFNARGVTQQNISATLVRDLRIPLPPMAEQWRVAAILDKADAVRRKRRESFRLLDEFLRSAFIDMFGNPVQNEKGWMRISVGDLLPERALIVDGPFGSSLKPDSYISEGVRVIRNFNIRDDDFDHSAFKYISESKFAKVDRSEVIAGDVLISTKGTLGNVCLMPDLSGKAVLSASGTVRLRLPDEGLLRRQFLVSQMVTNEFKGYLARFEAGTNQKYLNLASIRKLEVIVPPIEVQDRFCRLRDRSLELRGLCQEASEAAGDLFDSLVQRSFQ